MNIQENSSFSTKVPALQLAWDSTSMGLFKECPRKYYYTMILGMVPRAESVHLTFGIHYHAALERYDHARAQGKDHEAATLIATRYALTCTWDANLRRPWLSDDNYKNRETLVRTVVWYLDHFGANDPLETVILANGKPAVELSFRFESGYFSREGEQFLVCGHLDKLAHLNDATYIVDRKTTKSMLGTDYFDKFTPDNQFSTYTMGCKIAYATQVSGLIVDAAQVAVNFSRFQRAPIPRSEAFLQEWFQELGWYLQLAEACAVTGKWPGNDKSCGNYGGCPFRGVCSKSPLTREQWIKASFVPRKWDPLKTRGDI